jgi:hypothetical protein
MNDITQIVIKSNDRVAFSQAIMNYFAGVEEVKKFIADPDSTVFNVYDDETVETKEADNGN